MEAGNSETRVLIFAPIGRDGPSCAEVLRRAGWKVDIRNDLPSLVSEIRAGAGAALIAEEGLYGKDISDLADWVAHQPAWADLPFILLTSRHDANQVLSWRRDITASLRNVSLLERPIQPITLAATVRAALRARARQYEIRALMQERERATSVLEALVAERTQELQATNTELVKQMEERARVEESLRQSQKIEAIGQLTGGVAHDFNNLLMVISGGLEMLRRQIETGRRERLLDGMQKAAQRGAALTRQLLAFSRRQELKPEPLNVARQIEKMRELLDRSLQGDVHVTLDFVRDLWNVEVDAGELELVILNLAVNARDAMPSGGAITIAARNCPALKEDDLHGDFVRLSVSDTGMGMSPEVQARVFEPFFTTKEIGKGSGLGLAQVHGFVSQSHGAVRIHSEPGAGTTISLYLPRSDKIPLDEPLSDTTPVESDAGANSRLVLLVEDDTEVAKLTMEMLDQLGFQVIRAESAAAALGALANGRSVDLVFSDVMMPGGMNGVELAREIKTRRRELPVLLTSGFGDSVRSEAEALGVRILPKPYGLNQLSSALKTLVESDV
jgi:signal transduction histidine kinase